MGLEGDSDDTGVPGVYDTGVWPYEVFLGRSGFDLESNMILCVIEDLKIAKRLLLQLKMEAEFVGTNGDELRGGHGEEGGGGMEEEGRGNGGGNELEWWHQMKEKRRGRRNM